jgi:protein tyrosine phosphatase
VTQWPMKSTIRDFWRLVSDYKMSTIVLVDDCKPCQAYPSFWPVESGSSKTYGQLTVKLVEHKDGDNVTTRLFQLGKVRHNMLLAG